MNVTIVRVGDQKGFFHVHKTGCADLGRMRGYDSWSENVASVRDTVLSIYGDGGNMGDHYAKMEYRDNWEEYMDLHVLPCLDNLPDTDDVNDRYGPEATA